MRFSCLLFILLLQLTTVPTLLLALLTNVLSKRFPFISGAKRITHFLLLLHFLSSIVENRNNSRAFTTRYQIVVIITSQWYTHVFFYPLLLIHVLQFHHTICSMFSTKMYRTTIRTLFVSTTHLYFRYWHIMHRLIFYFPYSFLLFYYFNTTFDPVIGYIFLNPTPYLH